MNVALYGLGRMGAHHQRHLVAAGHAVAVFDPARGLRGDERGVEAVVVATPTRTHLEVALPWLERGVPVLVEKPLASSVSEAEILAAFPHCAVGHVERFNPAFEAIRQVSPGFVQAERLAPWADRGTDVDVVLDLMIHDLDLFAALTRSPVREVRANGLAVRSGLVDIVHARVETGAGQVGVFTASRISRKAQRSLRVFAAAGYYSADLKNHTVTHVDGALTETAIPIASGDALAAELRAFFGALGGGERFCVSAADALSVLRVAEVIRCACS